MRKSKALFIILMIYLLAYAAGAWGSSFSENIIVKAFIFDTIATVVVFIFSAIFKNSSVYDAYWSLTPMVMTIYLFVAFRAFSVCQLLFFTAFNIWSLRLTVNWITVFTDFNYEDWRYRKFRDETPKLFWPLVNFWGIHYMPTVIVFAGMLPIFTIINNPLGAASLPGIIIILAGVLLELFADREMHYFLAHSEKQEVCNIGLWRYSRHPNYLGEITVWLGVFLTMLPYAYEKWYLGVGFISVMIMFNIISIPLMEKRQKERRPMYWDYIKKTSRLILLPERTK